MDDRTKTDLAIVSGHHLRNSGPVAFIDESFATAAQDYGGGFYLLSAVVYEKEFLDQARKENNRAAGTNHWHTTNQNDSGNKTAIQALSRVIGEQSTELIVAGLLDLEGLGLEQARKHCMAQLLAYLNQRNCKLVIYERPALRSEVNSDSSQINKLRNQGLIGPNNRVIPSSPSAENLLWSADLLAWVVRRLLTHNEPGWIKSLSKTINLIEVSEPKNTPEKEKGSGPAVACPDLGLSVTHKSEGTNRSSPRILSHKKTIGQACRQLLVNQVQPSITHSQLKLYLED